MPVEEATLAPSGERQEGVEAVRASADQCPLLTPLTSHDNQAACCVFALRGKSRLVRVRVPVVLMWCMQWY